MTKRKIEAEAARLGAEEARSLSEQASRLADLARQHATYLTGRYHIALAEAECLEALAKEAE